MPKLIRVTTVPMALRFLLPGQMKFMKANGFDVIMVSADGPGRDEVVRNEGCPHVVVNMTRSISPLKDLAALWAMIRLFRKEQPDIVHSHTPKAGLIAMLAAWITRVPVRVHTVAGLRFMTSTGVTRRVLVLMEKITARAATHVWPNSNSLLQYIRKHRLAPFRKLEVIGEGSSNGIDLGRFRRELLSPAELDWARGLCSYEPGDQLVLTVGRLVRDKGISELVAAFKNLSPGYPALRLVLVGGTEEDLDPLDPSTMELIRSHPRIVTIGWQDKVEVFLCIASMLVHPSYREGFPNVLLQAGALGVPVLASRIEGNVDIVTDHETGFLFAVKDAESLEKVFRAAMSEENLLASMGSALFQKVTRYYDREYVHQCIKNKYLAILDDQSKP